MPRNTSVSLGEHFTGFIDAKVKEGRYSSASDVVRAGLRLLEEREANLEQLRALIDEGIASGIAEEFDWDDFRTQKRAAYEAREKASG
ncbi:type II toxin-antitoxin system ParD family antitoxin [Cognatiyoonia sp. IB215446]|uniref:type II toxin-antitoxin system ParD family antitoxin n=1 Tax=Cognatiyoonia sp. IB215446 TaxID=3097355 RepID=UPI002A0C7DE9|nr:type II toxin-antitoxin system ParD family antitoxin [Cognatiyoonia sp. IB215446]MDX8346457.1 type II toxin-antitoxin system ParD family antitoxin [Cognatiyoonia sp. IB215446]